MRGAAYAATLSSAQPSSLRTRALVSSWRTAVRRADLRCPCDGWWLISRAGKRQGRWWTRWRQRPRLRSGGRRVTHVARTGDASPMRACVAACAIGRARRRPRCAPLGCRRHARRGDGRAPRVRWWQRAPHSECGRHRGSRGGRRSLLPATAVRTCRRRHLHLFCAVVLRSARPRGSRCFADARSVAAHGHRRRQSFCRCTCCRYGRSRHANEPLEGRRQGGDAAAFTQQQQW